MSLFLLSFLISVNASFVCLSKNWVLSWKFSGNLINFSLQLNQDIANQFEWVGLGFKEANDRRPGMIGADLVNIFIGAEPVDAYAECDCEPTEDEDLLTSNDLKKITFNRDYFIYSWNREVDTGDLYDLVLKKDLEVKVLWAAGKVVAGVQLKHDKNDYGVIQVKLSDHFESDCQEVINLS
jgi:hypothetical protein